MYVPHFKDKEMYELFIENREKDIVYLQDAIRVAKKRIKEGQFYENGIEKDDLIFDK